MINPATSAADAAWVTDGTTPPQFSIGGMVPVSFPAYARVFHSVYPDTWASVAEEAGVVLTPTTQWEDIKVSLTGEPTLHTPRKGTLQAVELSRLATILHTHTRTAEDCWFGVWEGWGDVSPPPTFAVIRWLLRDLFLLRGSVFDAPFASARGATIWWPSDRSWFVATEVDFDSTIVAGSSEAIAAILSSELCAREIEARDELTVNLTQEAPS